MTWLTKQGPAAEALALVQRKRVQTNARTTRQRTAPLENHRRPSAPRDITGPETSGHLLPGHLADCLVFSMANVVSHLGSAQPEYKLTGKCSPRTCEVLSRLCRREGSHEG